VKSKESLSRKYSPSTRANGGTLRKSSLITGPPPRTIVPRKEISTNRKKINKDLSRPTGPVSNKYSKNSPNPRTYIAKSNNKSTSKGSITRVYENINPIGKKSKNFENLNVQEVKEKQSSIANKENSVNMSVSMKKAVKNNDAIDERLTKLETMLRGSKN
jgi:hypothetical protein